MTDINAGIVVVTEFCTAENSKFTSYIKYMDREEARKEHTADYVLDNFKNYLNYMDNPEKLGGLFTNDKDTLNDEDVKKLQSIYKVAQDNDSLMWQTVISFDNDFLSELGIYDEELKQLDDNKLKVAARKAINKMLEKEDLQNAVWSGAIHYNTDNIHIHVATVEPSPLREKKLYKQYEKIKVNGKWKYKFQTNEETGKKERIPILDSDGNIKMKEEYKGKFKNSSIEACKRELASSLVSNKELNAEITSIIRDKILISKEINIAELPEIKDEFFKLYNDLPKDINRSLWKYKASIMKPFQMQIDKISKLYIDNYQKDNFTKLENKLIEKQEIYEKVYGGSNNVYDNAIEDLYYRLGNKILKEIIYYDKSISYKKEQLEKEKQTIKKGRKNTINYVIDDIHRQNKRNMQIAMYQLRKSLNREYEKWKNLQEYEELQYQISKESEEIEI